MKCDNVEKAKKIIHDNIYMTLATSDMNGTPWAAPLYYAYDSDYNFYFISASDSLHSEHIKNNPKVSLAIYDSHALAGEGDGVQIEALAYAARLSELPHILFVYFKRRFPDELERAKKKMIPSLYMGANLFWFFKVIPNHIYTLDLSITKVDTRIEVNFKDHQEI